MRLNLSNVPRRALRLGRLICVSTALGLILAGAALAQGVRGTISGKVTDSSGAVVQGATVRLTNAATRQEVPAVTTDSNGNYQFVEVEPATYDLVVSMSGFADVKYANIKLEPDRHITLDAALKASGGAVEVTVSAGQELIDRETPTLGTTVDNKRILDLPLNGRNVLSLVFLQPGVTDQYDPDATRFGDGLGFRVNGQRGVENNLMLDGANNNEVAVGADLGVTPPPDAVEEFRVLTTNFEAEYGRNTGAVIDVVTKGGTNQVHGDARIFWRPTGLSAGRFFDNEAGLPKRIFERKQFGGDFGAPVYIPGVYDGRDKAFFFLDYEGNRQLTQDSSPLITGLPTADERNGIFSTPITDPATGNPFPGNRISPQRFSPIAKYYLQFLPIPNASGEALLRGPDTNNFDHLTGRFDYQLTSKQRLSFIANYFNQHQELPFPFQGAPGVQTAVALGFGETDTRSTFNYTLEHTFEINPRVVNSLLISYGRNDQPAVQPTNRTTPAQIGFMANFVVDPRFAGPPTINLFDRNLFFGSTIQGPQTRVSQNYELQDSVTWVKGDHRLKFGFDGGYYRQPQQFLFVNDSIITYSGQFQFIDSTGNDFADFLLGSPPIAFQTGANGERDFRQKAVGSFVQDDWKVKSNLTLSLGLRWEYNGPLHDALNRVAYYRPGSTSQLLANGKLIDPTTGLPITLAPGSQLPNGLVYVGDPDNVLGGTVPAGGSAPYYRAFAPRIGLAYSPHASGGWLRRLAGDDATVLRAGWGLFYGAQIGDTILQQLNAPGYNGTNFFISPGSGSLANPFGPDIYGNVPPIPNPFSFPSIQIVTPLGAFSQAIDPHLRTPYTNAENLTVERSFANSYVVSLSYVGNRGHRLYVTENLNPALGTFFQAPPGYPVANPTNTNSRRLNMDYPGGINQLESAGNSWYNAFEAQVQKRYGHGLEFQVAYTFSKSMNDSDDQRGALDVLFRGATRGLSSDDRPHRLVGSWVWDVPFAKNLRSGWQRTVLDGFSLVGIYTFASGTPFTIGNPSDTEGTGGSVISFADLNAPYRTFDPRKNSDRAFNPDVVVQAMVANLATGFRRGTEGPNQFRLGNIMNNWDIGVHKSTRLWNETTRLELRLEMFNALNHAQFTSADTNLLDVKMTGGSIDLLNSPFGKFTNTAEARIIQLAARISF